MISPRAAGFTVGEPFFEHRLESVTHSAHLAGYPANFVVCTRYRDFAAEHPADGEPAAGLRQRGWAARLGSATNLRPSRFSLAPICLETSILFVAFFAAVFTDTAPTTVDGGLPAPEAVR